MCHDEATINLLEMRFHIPSESQAKEYQADILDHADVLEARGKAIATFENLQCLIPRGRFEIKLYEKLMHVRGRSHDYKIPYKTVLRSFCLPHTDGVSYFFIVALDPPLKQGNTRYPFLSWRFFKKLGRKYFFFEFEDLQIVRVDNPKCGTFLCVRDF